MKLFHSGLDVESSDCELAVADERGETVYAKYVPTSERNLILYAKEALNLVHAVGVMMGRKLRISALAWMFPFCWIACGGQEKSNDGLDNYEQGRKAATQASIPEPKGSQLHDQAYYYRSMSHDARSSPGRYYRGPDNAWKSQEFRRGFTEALFELLQARAKKAEGAVVGTPEDFQEGRKWALSLASSSNTDFKALPAAFAGATGGVRGNLESKAETYYRVAFSETGKRRGWVLESQQFRVGFVAGFLDLCGVADFESKREVDRRRRSAEEDYEAGRQSGKKVAELADVNERLTMRSASANALNQMIDKYYLTGDTYFSGYDSSKESARFKDGFVAGFKAACGIK